MSRSRSRRKRSSGGRSAAHNDSVNSGSASSASNDGSYRAPRFTSETKRATKTTELIVFVAAVLGVIMTALQVDEDPGFGAERAWLYITILTVGYMISRGLAKSRSRETAYDRYDD